MEWKAEALSDSTIIQACNEIYAWRHKTGTLSPGIITNASGYTNIEPREIEKLIIAEAHKRLHTVVTLLMCDSPQSYLK